jgi:hypothetical protein
MVDLPFLNPNCVSAMLPLASTSSRNLFYIILSRSFPSALNMYSGLYFCFCVLSLIGLGMSTSLAIFHAVAVILSGRRKLKTIKVKVGNTEITTKKSIRYLGVMIDKDLKMTEHIKKTAERVDKTIATLTRIMPSEGGPSSEKRKILASVAESIILYGSVIWEPALKIKKYSDLLTRCQRKVVLRVILAYKTVSTAALLVIAGTPPIDLLARERNEIHKKGVKKKKEERE